MNRCPNCGQDHETTVRFCPSDGTPLGDTLPRPASSTPTSLAAAQSQVTLPILVGARYELMELRGGGGMAKVYKATDLTLERIVAVKLINPELRADPEFDTRFHREARIASQLADPNIVVVHDFGIDAENGPFLVMEFLEGATLRERLNSQGPLTYSEAFSVWGALLLALDHAHGKEIIHRDIKPDNVFLVNQSGVRVALRVLDFGIARMLRRGESLTDSPLTLPGAVVGTPRYMAPEQLAGQPVDARSDLYSAALVIHEALTGSLPYAAPQKLDEACPEAPPLFRALLEECLRSNPLERPFKAIDVYQRLQSLDRPAIKALDKATPNLAQEGAENIAPTQIYNPQPASRRHVLKTALLVGIAAVFIAGVAGLLKSFFFGRPQVNSDTESLLGIKIGDDRDSLAAILKEAPQTTKPHGNPWNGTYADRLGHVLRPADLEGENASLDDLDLLFWSKENICVVLRANAVEAVVVHKVHGSATGRGIKIGDTLKTLEALYPIDLDTDIHPFHAQSAALAPQPHVFGSGQPKLIRTGKIYRYPQLGIGFELIGDQVTRITLFPPAPAVQ